MAEERKNGKGGGISERLVVFLSAASISIVLHSLQYSLPFLYILFRPVIPFSQHQHRQTVQGTDANSSFWKFPEQTNLF